MILGKIGGSDLKLLSCLVLLAMFTPIETEMGTYTHDYQLDTQTGFVSNGTGPVIINYFIQPYSDNVFEFNCSEGDEIEVRMWDSDNSSMFGDPFDEDDYIIVNDTTKKHPDFIHYDDLYHSTLPGTGMGLHGPRGEMITIDIRGEGNYTLIVHWREFEEWERGHSSSYTRYAFYPTPLFYVTILGMTLLFIGSIVAIKKIILILKGRSKKI